MTNAALQWYLPATVGAVFLGLYLYLAAERTANGRVWRIAGIVLSGAAFAAFAVVFVMPLDVSFVTEWGLREPDSAARWSHSLLAEWPFATLFAIATVGGLAASVIVLRPPESSRAWSLLVIAGCNAAVLILIDAWTEALLLGGASAMCVFLQNWCGENRPAPSTNRDATKPESASAAAFLAGWGIAAVLLGGIASTLLADPVHNALHAIDNQAAAAANNEQKRTSPQLPSVEILRSNAMAFAGLGGVILAAVAVIQRLRKRAAEDGEEHRQGGMEYHGR